MLIDLGLIKVGYEIEIPAWDKDRTYQKVASELVEAGYMQGPASLWAEHHKYHCTCTKGGCRHVRSGDVYYPPLVSLTYDASLPKTGAEFIISPILMSGMGLDDRFAEIWDIISKDALWTMDLPDYHKTGALCSPSVHLHVSVTKEPVHNEKATLSSSRGQFFADDILHSLNLFTPELFLLADTAGRRRGLKFRLPTREAINTDTSTAQYGHHGFVQVKKAFPDSFVYLEWRLFEAAYDNFEYLQAVTYLSAGLTRGLLSPLLVSELMAQGYSNPYSRTAALRAIEKDDTSNFLKLADSTRLNILHEVCLDQLSDDSDASAVVDRLFISALRSVQ